MGGNLAFIVVVACGAAALAGWAYTTFASRRPSSLRAAAGHLGIAYVAFRLVPVGIRLTTAVLPHTVAVGFGLAVVTLPALTYLFTSWLWTLACLRDALPSKPSGGNPVSLETP